MPGSCKLIKSDIVGCKKLFNDKDAILDYLKSHPDADGKEFRNALAPHVTQSCFYNILNRLDITYKKEVRYKNAANKSAMNLHCRYQKLTLIIYLH